MSQSREDHHLSPEQQRKKHDDFSELLKPFYHGKALYEPVNTAKDKWTLVPAFLKVKGLVKQHIDSFNYFVESELKKVVRANQYVYSDVDDKFWLKYTDIRVRDPNRPDEDDIPDQKSTVTPNECRLRDMTYAAPIYVDIEYRRGGQKVVRKNIRIGRMPIMLKSARCVLSGKSDDELASLNECSVDPGGYFVIKGQEKVILVQEQLSKNRVIVESQKGIVQASVTSSTHERKSKSYVLLKRGRLYLKHNFLSEDIPIVIVLKAMGVQSDYEILLLVAGSDSVYQDEFAVNFEEAVRENIQTQSQALEYVGNRCKLHRKPVGTQRLTVQQEALEALATIVIAHVPVTGLDFRPKALYIAFMVRRVLMAMYDPKLVDDRDYVGNKRLELAGQMLSLLFEDHFKRFNTDFKLSVDKVLRRQNLASELNVLNHFTVHGNHITSGMERAIGTGNWNLKRFKMERAGVSHVLSRLSYISALGMMTRISSQFEKTRKVSGPRALQPSQFGMLCPSDTPEGEACGLVKNLALMTHITTEDDEETVRRLVFVLGAEDVATASGLELYAEGAYLVFINGTPIALTQEPKHFIGGFRRLRRMGRVSEFVSIYLNKDHGGVHIATDEGRICRPLIIVEKGKSKLTARYLKTLRRGRMEFDDFLSRGIVEYLDVNEENDALIAVYEKEIVEATTHLEIEPFTLLGAVAGVIPYPHHNQSPRNTYQCAMGKQAIGAIAYNQFERIDSLLYLMVYPQKPLVKTRSIELIKYDKLPAGQNAVVAVMSYSGYDIEDALILNRSSCERGFGRCQVFRKVNTLLKTYANGSQEEIVVEGGGNSSGGSGGGSSSSSKLGSDGIVDVGVQLEKNDPYLVKRTPLNVSTWSSAVPLADGNGGAAKGKSSGSGSGMGTQEWKTSAMTYRLPDPCYIDKVLVTANEQNVTMFKMLTRQTRVPEVGDKFSSRHGQKGVVGLLVEQADLPFSDAGIVPDVVMNPHGFPSRMTVGKLLELLAGKAGVLAGRLGDATAFGGDAVEQVADELLARGFAYAGKDALTSGTTGDGLPAYVFSGPIYYQKLKHMVQDKMHARARGPRATLTRQPTEGRSKDGGLRLGEMERDCLVAYGASQLLIERLLLSSDPHDTDVCQRCGNLGYQAWCHSCRSSAHVTRITIPYAAKLLIQELLSMNIKASLKLDDRYPDERPGTQPLA